MEPDHYRASDHNKTQLFTQKCSELIEEMESLNTATKEWNGKVGFSNGRFYSTGFSKHTEAPQRQLSYLEQAKAKASGAISRIEEKAYRQIWRASTTATLQAIDTLRVDIGKQLKLYKEMIADPVLKAEEKEELIKSQASLVSELQKTKEEGLKRLKERYESIPSSKGDQETIRRAHEFQTIYEKFTAEEIENLSDEDLKSDKNQRANRQIIRNGKDYTANLTSLPLMKTDQLLLVTDKIIADAVYDATFRDPKKTIKSQLEENTFQIQPYLHVPDLIPQGGREEAAWVSKRCLKTDVGFKTTINEVYSTAERAEIEKELKKNKKGADHDQILQLEKQIHLPNIKVQNDPRLGHLTITCGLIDTELKADEFIETVMNELKQRPGDLPPMKVRLCLHQLNSRAAEKKYVEFQHRMSRYIEEQLRDRLNQQDFCRDHSLVHPENNPIVTHENSAFNVASEISPWEDAENQQMNLESYATRLFWGLEEISGSLSPIQKRDINALKDLALIYRETLADKKRQFDSAKDAKVEKQIKEELEKAQKEMKKIIKKLRTTLEKIPSSTDLYRNSVLSLLIDITKQAVPTSDEYAHRVRVTQVERNFILDIITGSISELNCKSGLDRTGLARSLWDSMATMMKDKMDQLEATGMSPENVKKETLIYVINLVNNQDELSKIHNKYMEKFLETKDIDYKIQLETYAEPYRGNFRKEYLAFLGKEIKEISKESNITIFGKVNTNADLLEALTDSLHYQDLVGYHLLTVGLPITQTSTGVVGLKYNHKKESKTGVIAGKINQHLVGNPHPLRRIPMFIQQENGQIIRMIEGEKALTDAAFDLFERLSPNRGG